MIKLIFDKVFKPTNSDNWIEVSPRGISWTGTGGYLKIDKVKEAIGRLNGEAKRTKAFANELEQCVQKYNKEFNK